MHKPQNNNGKKEKKDEPGQEWGLGEKNSGIHLGVKSVVGEGGGVKKKKAPRKWGRREI